MKAIWKRELRGYFHTPVGYVFLCVFLLSASVIFYLTLLRPGSADMPAFISFLSLLWMLLSPILTMRLLAEERQKKTDQLLLTSPASLSGIVLGKYLAAVAVLLLATVLTLLYALVVALYGRIYPGELAVNLLGFILLGCAFTALDLFISSCAATPVTAAVMAFGANFFLWILDLVEQAVPVEWISDVLRFFSLYQRNEPLIAGQLSFATVLFDLSFIAVFLALTVFRLDAHRVRRARYRAISALILAFVTAALALLSIGAKALEKRHGWTLDASFNHVSSHTASTERLLAGLTHDVKIQALFSKGDEDTELMALLDRYGANPHVTWEQVDPRLNPGLIRQYTTTAATPEEYDLLVSCEDTGRWRLIKSEDYIAPRIDLETGNTVYDQLAYEWEISLALDYVSRDRVPQVVILYGFREDMDRNTALYFENFLTYNRYEVTYRQLDDPDFTPDPQDLLVFLSPQRDLTEEELAKAKAFEEQGGSFFFVRDAQDPVLSRYAELMRIYGFECLPGIVVEETPGMYFDDTPYYLIPEMASTSITQDLIVRRADHIRLPGAAAFQMPDQSDRYKNDLAAVLTSSDQSYLKQQDAATLAREDGDPSGPFALALQATVTTTQGADSRAFVLGSSAALLLQEYHEVTDMPLLTVRVLEYLQSLPSESLDYVTRDAARPLLESGDKRTGALIITALPALALLAALLVLPRRRRR